MNDDDTILIFYGLSCVLIAIGFLLPAIIAFLRRHHYRWIILAVNIVFGATGVGYLVAFVWAVWPRKTAVWDVLAGDPTTNSREAGKEIYGRLGGNIKAFKDGVAGTETVTAPGEIDALQKELHNLQQLKEKELISSEEYEGMRRKILGI